MGFNLKGHYFHLSCLYQEGSVEISTLDLSLFFLLILY
jgi:hypothetical protein